MVPAPTRSRNAGFQNEPDNRKSVLSVSERVRVREKKERERERERQRAGREKLLPHIR